MRYRLLGKSGLRVSELCLGTMTFGENWSWGASKDESRRIFDRFAEAGGNFIDTASGYTDGASEHIVGELTASDRDRFVIATKYSLNPLPVIARSGNSRKHMLQSVETSLRRLKTDRIDVLWLHAWDYTTPIEEVMRAFDDLVRQGKVNYVGFSDTPAWVVSRAHTLAELRGWTPVTALQLQYNLAERAIERELIPMARGPQGLGMDILAWSPLAGGILTGKYNRNSGNKEPGRIDTEDFRKFGELDERSLKIAEAVLEVAREIGKSPSQVALNWLRQQPSVIPILGARKVSQIEDNLGCLQWKLEADQLKRLDGCSRLEPEFPQSMLASEAVRGLLFGEGMHGLLERKTG